LNPRFEVNALIVRDATDMRKVKKQKRAQDPIALRIFEKAIIRSCPLNIS